MNKWAYSCTVSINWSDLPLTNASFKKSSSIWSGIRVAAGITLINDLKVLFVKEFCISSHLESSAFD